ncbi:MAG: hypothetical protein RBR35_07220 [Salinivirgaceae bacterium]|nr:hypothetical protein [Salinivirgaceae bacterium]
MKSTKMEKFQEKGLKNLSVLNMNEMALVQGGESEVPPIGFMLTLSFTINAQGWFDGSLFRPGGISDRINEFD